MNLGAIIEIVRKLVGLVSGFFENADAKAQAKQNADTLDLLKDQQDAHTTADGLPDAELDERLRKWSR
jgi:hypothetical protein